MSAKILNVGGLVLRTWVHPLHAVRKSIRFCVLVVVDTERAVRDGRVRVRQGPVGVDVVTSPWRVYENGMCSGERPSSDDENELGKAEHFGGRCGKTTPLWCGCPSLFQCSDPSDAGVHKPDGIRRKPVACGGGGLQHLWDAGLGLECLVRPSRCLQVRKCSQRGRLRRMSSAKPVQVSSRSIE